MVDFKKLSRRMKPNGYNYLNQLTRIEDNYTTMPTNWLAIDTETTGTRLFQGHAPFAVSTCDQDGEVNFYRFKVNLKSRNVLVDPKTRTKIQRLIYSYEHHVFHNAKFDIRALSNIEIKVANGEQGWYGVRDTLLYSHVMDSSEDHGLKALAAKYLDISADDQERLQAALVEARRLAKKNGVEVSEEVQWDYCLVNDELESYSRLDAIRTAGLFRMYVAAAREEDQGYFVAREHALAPIVYKMETRGLGISLPRLHKERFRYAKLAKEAEGRTVASAVKLGAEKDFNLRSNQQLSKLLYDRLKLPVLKRTKPTANGGGNNPSTDAETLETLAEHPATPPKARPFLIDITLTKKATKNEAELSKYAGLAVKDSEGATVLHSSLNQTGTRLSRFSSSDPPQQNISVDGDILWVEKGIRSLRTVFGPRPGYYWIDDDYDNIEMRLLAWASREERLIKLFLEGGSYHELIAEILHGPKAKWPSLNKSDWKKSPEYKSTKNGNFARGYGGGEARTDATYGVPGAYQKLKGEFVAWSAFNKEKIKEAEETGIVKSLLGYSFTVPKGNEFTMALNSVIQGTAGEVIKYAMLAIEEDEDIRELQGQLVLPVHDQLIVEFPNSSDPIRAANAVKRAMESPGVRLGIPLTTSSSIVRKEWTKPEAIETTFVSQF